MYLNWCGSTGQLQAESVYQTT